MSSEYNNSINLSFTAANVCLYEQLPVHAGRSLWILPDRTAVLWWNKIKKSSWYLKQTFYTTILVLFREQCNYPFLRQDWSERVHNYFQIMLKHHLSFRKFCILIVPYTIFKTLWDAPRSSLRCLSKRRNVVRITDWIHRQVQYQRNDQDIERNRLQFSIPLKWLLNSTSVRTVTPVFLLCSLIAVAVASRRVALSLE